MNLTIKEKMLLTTGSGMWHTKDLKGKLSTIHLSDGPHGLRKADDGKTNNESYPATCFPTASAVASSWNPKMVELMAESIANEAYNADVSILLGPGVNMKRSPLCGRNFEYFSEDPYLAGILGTAYVKQIEQVGIGTSLKHFCANSQETIRMTSNSMVDEKALREIYLKAFEMVVKNANPATVMASYNKINGLYATENTYLLTDILRKEWGFKGAVVSDWGACLRLTNALKAGMDLEMPDSHGYHLKKLYKDYKKGNITEEEISIPANRVLSLVEQYKVKDRTIKKDISLNHEHAIQIEEESAVLLENDGILPLKDRNITIIGGLAATVRYQGGGSSHINTSNVLNAIEAFTKDGYKVQYSEGYSVAHANVDIDLEEAALKIISKEDTILFFGGLPEFAEGEGYDRKTLSIPENQLSLLDKIYEINKNIIFISFGGAPFTLPFKDKCRAILHMYLGGEGVMEACSHLVSGYVVPSGKLAETFPLSIIDTPAYPNFATGSKDIKYKESIFIGYRYYDTFNVPVLYPFGYGKSYTEFAYSNLNINGNAVSFTIKNIGSYKGKEIAQVYVGRTSKDYLHAKKELKGFIKVELLPNEEQEVTIELPKDAFAIYDSKEGWITPKGEAIISIGKNVNEIVLEERILVEGIDYKKEYPIIYNEDIHKVSDDDFMVLYQKEYSHFDDVKKGEFTIENSLAELSKYSLKAKLLLNFAKNHMYKSFKGKPKDDPEVMMTIETIEGGNIDCIFCQGGIPYRIAESIVLSANGHRFKALHKLLWG